MFVLLLVLLPPTLETAGETVKDLFPLYPLCPQPHILVFSRATENRKPEGFFPKMSFSSAANGYHELKTKRYKNLRSHIPGLPHTKL